MRSWNPQRVGLSLATRQHAMRMRYNLLAALLWQLRIPRYECASECYDCVPHSFSSIICDERARPRLCALNRYMTDPRMSTICAELLSALPFAGSHRASFMAEHHAEHVSASISAQGPTRGKHARHRRRGSASAMGFHKQNACGPIKRIYVASSHTHTHTQH